MRLSQRFLHIILIFLSIGINFTLPVYAGERAEVIGVAIGENQTEPEKIEFSHPSVFYKTLGYHAEPIWVKIKTPTIEQNKSQNLEVQTNLIVLKNPLLWASKIRIQEKELTKFSSFPFPAFYLPNIDSQENIYAQIQSDAALNLDFEVMSISEYNNVSKINLSIYAAYCAVVLLLATLFFAYYLSTKKIVALAYAAELVFFHFFAIISLFGAPLIFLPESKHYFGTSFLVISECLACITTIWFTVKLVKKPFNKAETFLIAVACLTGVTSLIVQNMYMLSITLLICIMTIAATIQTFYRYRAENPFLQSYLVAFCFLSTGVLLYTAQYLGFTQNYNNRLFIFAGSIVELSIITITLIKIFYQEQTHLQYYAATLGGLVSQATLKDIMTNKERITFETVSTDLTVVFVDIVGYTEASRTIQNPSLFEKDVQQLLHLIRSYIIESGGEVNKTLGDGLLGYFGHSISGKKMENHAQIAIQCALRIQRASIMWIYNQKFHFPFRLRIGLSSGECRIGNIALDRLDYTITGDTVVLAQRMESACSPLKVLVSESVVKSIPASPEKIHEKLIHIKNQKNLVKAYEIDPFAGIQDYETYHQMALNRILQNNLKKRSSFQRFSVANSVKFSTVDPQPLDFTVIDISEGGMLLKSKVDLARNIQLVGNILDQRIGCLSRWSKQLNDSEYVVGVEFIRINTQDIDQVFTQLTKDMTFKVA